MTESFFLEKKMSLLNDLWEVKHGFEQVDELEIGKYYFFVKDNQVVVGKYIGRTIHSEGEKIKLNKVTCYSPTYMVLQNINLNIAEWLSYEYSPKYANFSCYINFPNIPSEIRPQTPPLPKLIPNPNASSYRCSIQRLCYDDPERKPIQRKTNS